MIEYTNYNDRISLITSNEESHHLRTILNRASEDDEHRLAHNYKHIELDDSLFHNIVLLDDNPVIFFYLQQQSWMPSTVARAYTRLYKDWQVRDRHYHMEFAPWMSDILNYNNRKKWLDAYGIETLFCTRELKSKREANRYLAQHGWNYYPNVCNIHDYHQHVWWMGEPNLDFLESKSVAPA